jgi:hypothetical protein
MLSQETASQQWQIQIWPIDRLVFYAGTLVCLKRGLNEKALLGR